MFCCCSVLVRSCLAGHSVLGAKLFCWSLSIVLLLLGHQLLLLGHLSFIAGHASRSLLLLGGHCYLLVDDAQKQLFTFLQVLIRHCYSPVAAGHASCVATVRLLLLLSHRFNSRFSLATVEYWSFLFSMRASHPCCLSPSSHTFRSSTHGFSLAVAVWSLWAGRCTWSYAKLKIFV